MYGWRGRIGLVVPANNTVIEPDFNRQLPDGVVSYTTAIDVEGGTEEGFEGQEKKIKQNGKLLREVNPDVAVYGVTTGSLLKGVGYEDEIESLLADAANAPAIATAASIKRAFDALGIKSIAVLTPYTEEMNTREVAFLEDSGYNVVDIRGQGMDSPAAIGNLSPQSAYREAHRLNHESADGIFISCTAYRTMDVVNYIQQDLEKPVVTSNGATIWDALRTIGINTQHSEPSQLFSE
jgi:maleate isomerase